MASVVACKLERIAVIIARAFAFSNAVFQAQGLYMDITELLAFGVKNKASDLHLSAGLPPMIRVHGDMRRINLPAMEHKEVHAMVYDIMNDGQRKHYEETRRW